MIQRCNTLLLILYLWFIRYTHNAIGALLSRVHATASAQLHVHVVDDVKELLHAGDLAVDAATKVFAGGSGKQIDGARII